MNEKHYELRFLPLFEDDLDEIVDYITYRLKNPENRMALGSRLWREGLACRLGLRCCVLTHPTVAIDGPRPL